MDARITRFRMKTDKIDEARRKLEQMRPRIMDLPGMRHFINVMGEDGTSYTISLLDETATAPSPEALKAVWAEFAPFMAGPPETPMLGEVVADWSK